MSQQNVALTRRVLDAFNSADLEAFVALMDEAVIASPRIAGGLGNSIHGHDGMRRWWGDLFDFMPDLSIEIVEARGLGEVTLIRTRYRGHGATSDAPFVETNWIAWRWRGAKCVCWASKATEAEALEAVR